MWENNLIKNIYFSQNLWCHNLFNKQLKYTYCPISQEVKVIRQWNVLEKLVPDLLLKYQNWTYQQSKVLHSLFLLHIQVDGYRKILKLRYRPLGFISNKVFSKTKNGMELVSLPHSLHRFWRKIFLTLHSINWPNFTVWLSLILEILESMCIAIGCFPGCGLINFEIHPRFLIKPFSCMTEK